MSTDTSTKVAAKQYQVGGTHYKDMPIQPIEFIHKNELGFCEGNIVKYACRHKAKGGIQDLDKIIHYAKLAKELYYGQKTNGGVT
jgi:hypothetical protein